VTAVLARKVSPPPLVFWCDPDRSWRDLLRAAAAGGAFELWCGDDHELVLRDRILKAPSAPRVVWVPAAQEEISFLKVLELQAELVWTETLVSALARFGVELARDHEAELRPLLPAHALAWIDRPRSLWRELTPGNAKGTLIDDDLVLRVLASPGVPVADLVSGDRIDIFRLRVTDDFGLPSPDGKSGDDWRVPATARLLATDAAVRVPGEPPSEGGRVIPAGPTRDRALRLLERWLRDVELIAAFEDLSGKADGTTSLVHWARNLSVVAPALASRAAEAALFDREVEHLTKLEDFEPLVRRMEERESWYAVHAGGFWGSRAGHRVPWRTLLSLARAATVLRQHLGVEKRWTSPGEAVTWFTTQGWEVDRFGELLFRDDAELPGGLRGVRARLRRAYLRHVDSINLVFSELLHHHGVETLGLSFAGEVLAGARPGRDPMAVLVLDACRYDLGARLAETLDRGEPARRTEIHAARAPLPSITPLGMPFALAEDAGALTVEVADNGQWRVTESDREADLAIAEARREWVRRRYKLKPASMTDVKSVLDALPPGPGETGRVLVVFGDEFDAQGHEGELVFTGADEYIDRYVRVIRRVRDAGYATVAVVTDHGFIHWEPEKDEVEPPPSGEVLWKSRRAIVGRGLQHPTAVALPVPGSDLECRVPRSVNAFRTYGKTGFFHGGATLQELVIPVVVARWPKKAEKVAAVLKPLSAIASLRPGVEVGPGASDLPGVGAEPRMMSRQVVVKVVEPPTGRTLFRSVATSQIDPDGAPVTITLQRTAGETSARGTRLRVEVRDADNDELLDGCDVELKVDLEEWD
jgi:hypothetical protein